MKTNTKELENSQVMLTVTLDAEEVKAIVKDVEKVFVREAQIPGFRKGKVPMELVRKEFANGIKQEVMRAMFQKNYQEAVKAEDIKEVALTEVKDVVYDDNGGSFVAMIDVKPKFKIPTYKGLKVELKETKVDEKDVELQLGRLRAAHAKFEDAKEGDVIAEGDYVQFDYEGTVGKKKILEINPEAKVVGEGKGFWTQIEEGRFLPEILDALKGMKIGETKEDVKAKFDKESAPEGLKGEKAVYAIKVTNFRRRILPNDAEFVEATKSESIEKLTATLRENMETALARQEENRRESEVIELLLKKADFDVPASQVKRSQDAYLQEFAQRAQYSGIDANYFKENAEKIRQDAEDAAKRQVRLWYVLEAIADAEKIEHTDDDLGKKVMDFILANVKK